MSCWWNITWNFFHWKIKWDVIKIVKIVKTWQKIFMCLQTINSLWHQVCKVNFIFKSSWNFKNNVLYLYKVQISSTKLASSTLSESWFGSTFCTVSLKLFLQYTHFDLTHTVWSFLWLLLEINLPFQKSNVLQFC